VSYTRRRFSEEPGFHQTASGRIRNQMDSLLNVLAMVGALLVLGWLVGSGDEQGEPAPAREELSPKRLQAQSEPSEER
jgi:hypothetical protein